MKQKRGLCAKHKPLAVLLWDAAYLPTTTCCVLVKSDDCIRKK